MPVIKLKNIEMLRKQTIPIIDLKKARDIHYGTSTL